MPLQNENIAFAFGLALGAGACTAVGACVVFIPSLIDFFSRKKVAALLGFSSGIMLFTSLVDLLPTAIEHFDHSEYQSANAFLYGMLCFFAGGVLTAVLNFVVHEVLMDNNHTDKECSEKSDEGQTSQEINSATHLDVQEGNVVETYQESDEKGTNYFNLDQDCCESNDSLDIVDRIRLHFLSAKVALAIAFHNFPEGAVTFVATVHNRRAGFLLSAAIALHNMPEGLCVAIPSYLGSGNRLKAFLLGSLSGFAEPLGALVAWAILENVALNDITYGVSYGVVAGSMTMICFRELISTAHRYDPTDSVVTVFIFFGMLVGCIGKFLTEIV